MSEQSNQYNGQVNGRWSGSAPQKKLVFDPKAVAKNLGVFCVLSAVLTFAVVLVVDAVVGATLGGTTMAVSDVAVMAVLVGVGGLVTGLLYIPAAGTVNEGLFRVAAVSLIAALAIYRAFMVGLDWGMLSLLTAVVCLAGIVAIVPSRVLSARREVVVTSTTGGTAQAPLRGVARPAPQGSQTPTRQYRKPGGSEGTDRYGI